MPRGGELGLTARPLCQPCGFPLYTSQAWTLSSMWAISHVISPLYLVPGVVSDQEGEALQWLLKECISKRMPP